MLPRFQQDADDIQNFLAWMITGVCTFLSLALLTSNNWDGYFISGFFALTAMIVCPRTKLPSSVKVAVAILAYILLFL